MAPRKVLPPSGTPSIRDFIRSDTKGKGKGTKTNIALDREQEREPEVEEAEPADGKGAPKAKKARLSTAGTTSKATHPKDELAAHGPRAKGKGPSTDLTKDESEQREAKPKKGPLNDKGGNPATKAARRSSAAGKRGAEMPDGEEEAPGTKTKAKAKAEAKAKANANAEEEQQAVQAQRVEALRAKREAQKQREEKAEKDAAEAARLEELRVKREAQQQEKTTKQAAEKQAAEAARREELRAKREAKRQQDEAEQILAETSRLEAEANEKKTQRLQELENKDAAGEDLTVSEYDELLAIYDNQWLPAETLTPKGPMAGAGANRGQGKGGKGKTTEEAGTEGCGNGGSDAAGKGVGGGKGKGHNAEGKGVGGRNGKAAISATGKTADAAAAKGAAKSDAKGQSKGKQGKSAAAVKTTLDEQATAAQATLAVDIWDMDACAFEDITRAQYRPQGRRSWAVVGVLDGATGRKEFAGAREGWRLTCKLRDEHDQVVAIVAFTESILWIEEQAATFKDEVVRVGPLSRKENSFTGKMDLHVLATTQILPTSEVTTPITRFPALCGGWPSQTQWEKENYARIKGEITQLSDTDVDLWVDGDAEATRFQMYGFHPTFSSAKVGDIVLVEVFPQAGGGQKISEHSIVRPA